MYKIYCETNAKADYPSSDYNFSPSCSYPEYPFQDISKEENAVYSMVRNGFYQLGLDREKYGTKDWNPLGDYIQTGDTVLLKPNWVMHENPEPLYHDLDCLVTHPSLIRAIVDYVYIALNGTGKVIVADAPMQECDLPSLLQTMEYNIIQTYFSKKMEIEFLDLRGVIIKENKNKFKLTQIIKTAEHGISVDLAKHSAFNDLDIERIQKLRTAKYSPEDMNKHHSTEKHEYILNPIALNADVIINLAKPKSHRKSGLTACCKNFIGINMDKAALPHCTYGSIEQNGDVYLRKNHLLTWSNFFKDLYNKHLQEQNKKAVGYRILMGLCRRVGIKLTKEKYWDGSWYRNDTMWRTISDITDAVYYADKNGKLQRTTQRTIFNICDMIISGEKEGPLSPTPKKLGTIMMSAGHAAGIDKFICKFVGFDNNSIKYIDYLCTKQGIYDENLEIIFDTGEKINYIDYQPSRENKLEAGFGWHGFIDL
ncbi:DUF362 domain-containing protein [Lachnospiraceae bacterium 62-35]